MTGAYFPALAFPPRSDASELRASGMGVCPRSRSLEQRATTPVILFTTTHIAFAAH